MADDPPANTTIGAADPSPEPPGADPALFATLEVSANVSRTETIAHESDLASTGRLDLVYDVPVCLSVELGRTDVPIRDVVNLGRGSIIELDRGPGTPLDVRVNGVLIGRGEVVLVNAEKLGLRFVEVVSQADSPKRSGS
jgi:flagellar motor switch protein FliN/FliY